MKSNPCSRISRRAKSDMVRLIKKTNRTKKEYGFIIDKKHKITFYSGERDHLDFEGYKVQPTDTVFHTHPSDKYSTKGQNSVFSIPDLKIIGKTDCIGFVRKGKPIVRCIRSGQLTKEEIDNAGREVDEHYKYPDTTRHILLGLMKKARYCEMVL